MSTRSIVKTKNGHELEYIGKDRGMFRFRLRNLLRDGRYVGDLTRQFDRVFHMHNIDDAFCEIMCGLSITSGELSVVECNFVSIPDNRSPEFLGDLLRVSDINDLESELKNDVVSLAEVERAMPTNRLLTLAPIAFLFCLCLLSRLMK